jgi:hypothetical protein
MRSIPLKNPSDKNEKILENIFLDIHVKCLSLRDYSNIEAHEFSENFVD